MWYLLHCLTFITLWTLQLTTLFLSAHAQHGQAELLKKKNYSLISSLDFPQSKLDAEDLCTSLGMNLTEISSHELGFGSNDFFLNLNEKFDFPTLMSEYDGNGTIVTIWMLTDRIDVENYDTKNDNDVNAINGNSTSTSTRQKQNSLMQEGQGNLCFCFIQEDRQKYWCQGMNCMYGNAALCERALQNYAQNGNGTEELIGENEEGTIWNWKTFWILIATAILLVNVLLVALWFACKSQRKVSRMIVINK